MIAALILLAGVDDALIATARERLSPERRCPVETASTDVTVCGLRRADRYRVPLVEHDPGDPRYEIVAAERNRWLARTTPLHDHSPFLVGGGMAGVHATLTPGGGSHVAGLRPLAP